MDFTMESFDPATANIDAMLAVTFARNMKMMKFINKIYDADKDYYAGVAKKNSRFKSRLITDNRITIKLNAIKALAIITAVSLGCCAATWTRNASLGADSNMDMDF
ncbi:MAG: hypothetical protein IKW79_02705 [Schwartzia sp.]|nr:hypothetical protein [Schwartzia sp. (in: firmicutes)]